MKVGAIIISLGEPLFPAAVEMLRAETDRVVAIENYADHPNIEWATLVRPAPMSNAENVNEGWRILDDCDLIVICNADIIVPQGWRQSLEDAMNADPELGAASLPMNVPERRPGYRDNTPLVFTAVRRSAVTWADCPLDERFVNEADDPYLAWRLATNGWKQMIVEGPSLFHQASSLSRDVSFKSGEPCHRQGRGVFEANFDNIERWNT